LASERRIGKDAPVGPPHDAAGVEPPGDAAGENIELGVRMRATKGYVAGVGTSSALVGAIGCAFALLTTVVAVQGWPLVLGSPGTATLEARATADPLPPLGVFPAAEAMRRAVSAGGAGRSPRAGARTTLTAVKQVPVASAFGPASGQRTRRQHGFTGGPALAAGPAAGVGIAPKSGAGSGATSPPASPVDSSAGGSTIATTPPPTSGGSSATLGGTVTEVTSGVGTVVSQTGQQLGGTVQGATSQLGGAVGQVSPSVGQAVTQTGQVAGGVVSGATSTAGQVVSGKGTTVGRLLGGLGGG
jgi:hypothetical protein